MNDTMLQEPKERTVVVALWAVLICVVVIGSLMPLRSLPLRSPVMVAVGHLHVNDKLILLRLPGAVAPSCGRI